MQQFQAIYSSENSEEGEDSLGIFSYSSEQDEEEEEERRRVKFPPYREKLGFKKEYMDLVVDAHKHGYADVQTLEQLIAVRGNAWKDQDIIQAPGWSLKSMAVLVLLEHLPMVDLHDSPPAPAGLRWPGQLPGDLAARVKQLARRWRYLTPSEDLWQYLESFKYEFASRMFEIWPKPSRQLAYYCDVFAQIFKNKFLFDDNIRNLVKVEPDEITTAMHRWASREIKSHKKMTNGQAPPEQTRLYMSPVIRPGEEDEHARTEGGVFASNHRDILESQRPNICAEGLWEACTNFDTDGSNGILIFMLLQRISKQYCHLLWIESNLFLDTEIDATTMSILTWREYPYIFYLFGVYLVVNPVRKTYIETRSPVLAIQTWFKEFWKGKSNKYFDGSMYHKITNLPKTFPMRSREASNMLFRRR